MLTRRSTVLPTGRLRPEPTVAVVGLGYWGPNLVRVLIERTDVEVRWICDTDVSRLERYGRRYPTVRLTQDLDELLDDPDLDGVLLAPRSSRTTSWLAAVSRRASTRSSRSRSRPRRARRRS